MARVFIGAVVATIAMFFIGFIFFATPLARLSMAKIDDAQAASVQQALAANLPRTGTYSVPGMDTRAQTNMFSQGPIATVHYNIGGFAAMEPTTLAKGLVLNFIVALLIGAALIGIDRRVRGRGNGLQPSRRADLLAPRLDPLHLSVHRRRGDAGDRRDHRRLVPAQGARRPLRRAGRGVIFPVACFREGD
jgi:hypothetical protein